MKLSLRGVAAMLRNQWTEAQFKDELITQAIMCGWICFYDQKWLDFIGLRRNRLVVAELKVGNRRPSRAQERWLAAWRLVPGAEVFVWKPHQWSEIERVLE